MTPTDKKNSLDITWKQLSMATQGRRFPFHIMTLSYIDNKQWPSSCSLVTRSCLPSERVIGFHSDYRQAKIAAIQQQPRVAIHGYHEEGKRQLRLQGTAAIHHRDHICELSWSSMQHMSKIC